MRLSAVADALASAGIAATRRGADPDIVGVVHHTDAVAAGTLFCCVPGARFDGHDLAGAAVAAGATALLVERPVDVDAAKVEVVSVRAAMGYAAAAVAGQPSHELPVLAVTGTNGKTTVVSLLDAIFTAAGRDCRVIGTLTSQPGGPPTTPEAPELQTMLAAWRDDGADAVAMEVSSHALALGRVNGTRFAVAAFTMLGVDHLDFHGTVDAYFAAKAMLFESGRTEHAVVNVDDPRGAELAGQVAAAGAPSLHPTSLDQAADLTVTPAGSRFTWRGTDVDLPLAGSHNVRNALTAATMAAIVGIDDATIAAGLSAAPVVPGRFELVDAGQSFTVAVDYADSPDAIDALLTSARELAPDGRVVVVFGCGGDRDRSKRPQMAAVAVAAADVVVVTSDNPRSEDPEAIIDEIVGSLAAADRSSVHRDADRRRAIHHAVDLARHGDVVVIAGKGHETTQTFADRVESFDDRQVAREAIAASMGEDAS